VADIDARNKFVAAYDAKHSVKVDGKKASLIIGADDFAFPIPLIHTMAGWEFDTAEGRQEILYRRIGRNELDAIETCLAFADAENEYAEKDRGDGVGLMRNASSAAPARRTASIGRRTITTARWASLPPTRRRKATRPLASRSPITAIITVS